MYFLSCIDNLIHFSLPLNPAMAIPYPQQGGVEDMEFPRLSMK